MSRARSQRRYLRSRRIDWEIGKQSVPGASGRRLSDLSAEELRLVVDGVGRAVDGGGVDMRLREFTRAVGELSSALGIHARTGHRAAVQDVEPNSRRKIVARKAWT